LPLAKVYPGGLKIILPGARFPFISVEAQLKERLADQKKKREVVNDG
jgi:hypothetical protein